MLRLVAAAVIVLTLAPTPAAPASDADACAAAKMKAAAKYSACRIAADAKATLKALPPDYTKCDAKQQASWTKAEGKYGLNCPTTGDQAESATEITNAGSCLDQRLAGTAGTCETSHLPPCPVGGVVVDGTCWVASNPGDSCVAACALNSLAYDTKTETYASIQSNTIAHCDWILDQLGYPGTQIQITGPPNVGCSTTGGNNRYDATSVTDQGNYAGFIRVCGCS